MNKVIVAIDFGTSWTTYAFAFLDSKEDIMCAKWSDISNYKKIERILNRNNINKDICVIDSYNKNICIDNNKYLVKPSVILNNYNISNIISEIKSGYIIYINDDVSLENFKMLLKQINYKNINVVYLSKLISEEIIYKTN